MAHAGSGSASGSAVFGKGGILKFADVVRERFRGPAFGQDFTTWLEEVKWGFDTAQIPKSAQVNHLVAYLESPVREGAYAFVRQWKVDNPTPELNARAADRESRMNEYYDDMFQALVAHLKLQPTVVGTRPEMRLEHVWKSIKQLPNESVAMFNHRLQQLLAQLNDLPTADRPSAKSVYTTIVSGLKSSIRQHV